MSLSDILPFPVAARGVFMEHLNIKEIPTLRDPAFLMAFAGWNDASSAATTAASFLAENLGGHVFASIESDPFYNFQDMRPTVHLDSEGKRRITWPANLFYACETPQLPHDVIVYVGVEPHLQWNMFVNHVYEIVQKCDVRIAVTIGALLADVYHRSDVRITGSSTNPEISRRLGIRSSRYEGPTGIVGILNKRFQEASLPAVSVWANVPHYVNVSPNPKATLSLIRRLSEFLSCPFNLSEMESQAREFEDKVDLALEKNKAVREYVEELRRRSEESAPEETEPGTLPSGDEIARELQKYLREHREDTDENTDEEKN